MTTYRITLRQELETLILAASRGEARLAALEQFRNGKPLIVSTEELRPCQIDGKCPYPGNFKCSDCE